MRYLLVAVLLLCSVVAVQADTMWALSYNHGGSSTSHIWQWDTETGAITLKGSVTGYCYVTSLADSGKHLYIAGWTPSWTWKIVKLNRVTLEIENTFSRSTIIPGDGSTTTNSLQWIDGSLYAMTGNNKNGGGGAPPAGQIYRLELDANGDIVGSTAGVDMWVLEDWTQSNSGYLAKNPVTGMYYAGPENHQWHVKTANIMSGPLDSTRGHIYNSPEHDVDYISSGVFDSDGQFYFADFRFGIIFTGTPDDPNKFTDKFDVLYDFTPQLSDVGDKGFADFAPAMNNLLSLVPEDTSIYVQPIDVNPASKVVVNLNVANLAQPVNGLQALINFSSEYFAIPSTYGAGAVQVVAVDPPWTELIWDLTKNNPDNTTGDLDMSIGVNLDLPVGTDNDATTAKIMLKPVSEGTTQLVFRDDVSAAFGTYLLDMSNNLLSPTKVNSTNIVIDGTPPEMESITPANGALLRGTQEFVFDFDDANPLEFLELDIYRPAPNNSSEDRYQFTIPARELNDEELAVAQSFGASVEYDANEQKWTLTIDTTHDAWADGQYIWYIQVNDKAGNKWGDMMAPPDYARYVYQIDNTEPTVTINQAADQVDPTNDETINFTVKFSEPVYDFTSEDVTLGGTAGATTATVTGSGTTYNVAVTGMTQSGDVQVSIAAGVAFDAAGNGNEPSESTDNTVTYDIDAPTVTIEQAEGQVDPTNVGPINYTVIFSEPVGGFAADDVIISGAEGATASVTGSGNTYNVAVSGMISDGTIVASIAAGAATDAAGNASVASTSTDNAVLYDATAPVLSIAITPENVGDDGSALIGYVHIKVTVTETGSGLATDVHPTVTMTQGTVTKTATFTDVSSDGTFNYKQYVGGYDGFKTGAIAVDATVADAAGNVGNAQQASFDLNKRRILTKVELDPEYQGGPREVTFVAIGGDREKTWVVTVNEWNTLLPNIELTDVPAGTTHVSAKTATSLREILPVEFNMNDSASPGFVSDGVDGWNDETDHYLRGGDLNNNNSVNIQDYGVLKANWLSTNPAADINGDGVVNNLDYDIMKENWFRTGDEE